MQHPSRTMAGSPWRVLLCTVALALSPHEVLTQTRSPFTGYIDTVPEWSDSDVSTITINNVTVGLCASTHLCSSLGCQTSNRTTPETTPSPCYCDLACVAYGDCCYDYDQECGQKASPFDRKYQGLMSKKFSCVLPTGQSDSYLLVNACPEDNNDKQTAVLCQDAETEDALAAIPCYGTKSGVYYRNIYCAVCHGEPLNELMAWRVTIQCPDDLSNEMAIKLLQNSTRNAKAIGETIGCDIRLEPPSDRDDAVEPPRPCYPQAADRCPTPEHALSGACESYTAYVLADLDAFDTAYKNPHCAMCNIHHNEDQRVESATDCSTDEYLPVFYLNGLVPNGSYIFRNADIESFDSPFISGRRFIPPPMSIVFDFQSESNVKVVQNEAILMSEDVYCPSNEVYDPFTLSCRKLSCSEGYLLEGSRCLPDYTSVERACDDEALVYRIDVTLNDQCLSSTVQPEDNPVNSSSAGSLQLCLADAIGLDYQRVAQVTRPPPSVPQSSCQQGMANNYSFHAKGSGGNFYDVRRFQQSLLDSPLCELLTNSNDYWSAEISQHCESLSVDDCQEPWLNDTAVTVAIQNGTIVVNTTDGLYTLKQTIIRTSLEKRREELAVQVATVKVCADDILPCPLVSLNSSLFRDDENRSEVIVYTPTGETFEEDEYIRVDDGHIQVCSFYEGNGTREITYEYTFFEYSAAQEILSLIGNIISMIAAAATFVTYCVFKELRKRVSVAIMNLVASLFAAQLLLLVSGSSTANPAVCTLVAVLGHFFWLATVFWTGVLAFDLNRTFASSSQMRGVEGEKVISVSEVVFAFGGAMLIILPCLIIDLCDCTDLPLSYGNENVCWIGNGYVSLVSFGVPIGIMIFVNGLLFLFTVRGIHSTKKHTQAILKSDKTEAEKLREELLIYFKISTLMGFTWIFGFVAAFTDVIALWYVFIILNSSQGVLIFVSFIANKKVLRLWKGRVFGGDKHKYTYYRSSSLTPSSQLMLKHKKMNGSQRSTIVTNV